MGLQTVGRWKNLSEHWQHVAEKCYSPVVPRKTLATPAAAEEPSKAWDDWLKKRTGIDVKPVDEDDSEDEGDDGQSDKIDTEILLMRKFFSRWAKAAGVHEAVCDSMPEDEIHVDWTRVIAPVVEGRIKVVG
jgi:5'-nucleotidase